MDAITVLLAMATVTGFYMAWNIGANDVANAMGTSVGSGALTLRAAIVVAAVFEFGGAMLVGGSVTETISKGIVDLAVLQPQSLLFVAGMTCCLLAAALWLHIATYFAWPVSTTHSIVGAVVGFGIVAGGLEAVHWSALLRIVLSWVVSPSLGALLGYLCFVVVRKLVLNAPSPLQAMQRVGPWLLFPVFAALTLALLYKGLKPLRLDLPLTFAAPVALLVGLTASVIAWPLLTWMAQRARRESSAHELKSVEKVFLLLQIMTACFVAFAHGSNDVANAVGPLAAVYGSMHGTLAAKVAVPLNVLSIGAVGIVLGLATYGYRVMGTIGRDITELTPSRGFVAEFAAASTIVLASKLGLPVSTTHTLVGAVIGVGLARSIGAINIGVLRGIVSSWLITVPLTALIAAAFVLVARLLLAV